MFRRKVLPAALAAVSLLAIAACGSSNDSSPSQTSTLSAQDALATSTPIKHVVVIYNENVSFDHYFATYPNATNPTGEPAFAAAANTPTVNGLSGTLLTNNPNFTNTANGTGAANPFRLDRTQAATADQNHAYTAEQQAYDNGLADLFPKYTGKGTSGGAGAFGTTGQVMGYYDGNTVTALWNYAQNYAMSDNAYTDTYGPSTPGALEAISGQTNGMQIVKSSRTSYYVNDGQGGFTMINDVDPANDICSSTTDTALMAGKNIGDLLNAKSITWGGFMGGFNLSTTNANGTTNCSRSTLSSIVNASTADYIPHHNWFQYYTSTANPQHLRPSSTAAVGYTLQADGKTADPANHQYDSDDFFAAVKAGNFPSVSFVKAPAYQDGHAGYSDPLDEQAFTAKVVNFLQQQPDWKNTAVIVTWDDSDGWYDHAYTAPTSASFDSVADQVNGSGICGTGTAPNGLNGKPVNGRCGPGTRIPFVVISPYAKKNYVSHALISQASIVRFIEDNWLAGQRIGGGSFDATAGDISDLFDFKSTPNTTPVYVDPNLGTVVATPPQT
ncbi:alkaline phosphatase family protein [Trinickia caryophylli]|uniref:Phospholipase C n=1 Tax=Trinickia caryophylli TaxID=28094 RepID=A0A1X7G2P7_TRICW|nr:alkaline phosphatase family protein [Trinickia caryophylli]PMS13704.1 phospholipase [Trinickia caryophylli]TRX14197.1 alkaline phosphatase family protein [Trinickia caryophylli]WQE14021.1 alkaline phosphatase family protein [Trinickia caryophylli]SMF62764.1 phospholipase C [Trinickia caryophylli]GLU33493.1 phospholipase C [Trinickia caryophylli]